MAEAVFLVDIDADRHSIKQALSTESGIKSWWTTRANVPANVGEVMTVGFSEAPAPFQLRVDEASDERVRWTSVGDFPPHWVGTEVVFNLMKNPDKVGTRLLFEHKGFATADPMLGHTAFTWANLMHTLKNYSETGTPSPFFP